MPTTGPVSGRVYIWYPEGSNIGHAAMYLGNYEVGTRFELSIDPGNGPLYWAKKPIEKRLGINNIHFNDNYVSWWPNNNANLINPQQVSDPKNGLYEDIAAENSEPHVVYDVYGLDLSKMRKVWREARDKNNGHYQLYRKNCADLVLRVLTAGGAIPKISGRSGIYYSRNNVITTPKDVAVICNQLRDAGWAKKQKAGNCPSKRGNLLAMVLGMR